MLDNSNTSSGLWNHWKQSEGQLLEFQYFLGNQRIVSTVTKPFLITEGTKLQIEEVILGESIDVIVAGVKYRISKLTVDIPRNIVKYQSGKNTLNYNTGGNTQENFIRSWFTEI